MSEDPYAYVVAAFQALGRGLMHGPGLLGLVAPPSLVYIPYVPEPKYLEYIPVEDEVFPAEEQPLPAAASPTTDSPGYIPESDPDEDLEDDDDEDPKEDPADYLADHDDEEEEEDPSGDDADEEDEEQYEDDDDEEEEHSALTDSILPPPALRLLSSERRADRPEVTLPPRKRLSIVHRPGYEAGESLAAAATRPIEEDIGYGIRDAWIDPRDIAEEEALATLVGVNTRVTKLAAVQKQDTQDNYRVMEDAQCRQTEMFQRVETLVDDSRYHYETGRLVDQEARCS
nr:hypothetical protein [Tanacetum cinerariifolium]